MLTDELIDSLLFGGLEYAGQTADLILVPGSRKACDYRVPAAVELYHARKAGRLLFSGGRVQKTSLGEMPEYKSMLIAAEGSGVPVCDILTETLAMNTPENMRFSAEIIMRELPCCRSIIIVTTAYHMRRALMLAEKIMPQYAFFSCPVQMGSTTKDNWRLTEKGRRTALEECMKLKKYAQDNLINDMEIQ